MDLPIDSKKLTELKKAIKKSLEETQGEFDKQVAEMAEFFKKELTWGEFKIISEAIIKFIKE